MKRLAFIMVLAVVLGFTTFVNATLIDNTGGFIYDTDLNITWYDAQPLQSYTWYEAMGWVATLTTGGVTGWRLPHVLPVNGSTYNYTKSYDGSTDNGYNITSLTSELAYLFHVSLGNKGECKTDGSAQLVYGLVNKGPFTHLYDTLPYWNSTDYNPQEVSNAAFYFDFEHGRQHAYFKDVDIFAMAVHDGNIGPNGPINSVPIPPSVWLFGSGLLGLIGLRRKFKSFLKK